MFLNQIKNNTRVPVGGYWIYREAETSTTLQHPYLHELEKLAKKHRKVNNLPIGSDWESQFELNVCSNQPDECEESDPPLLTKAQSLAKALTKWALSGFKVATQEDMEHRLSICESCDQWRPKSNLLLSRCKACGCSGSKLFLKTSSCPLGKWI